VRRVLEARTKNASHYDEKEKNPLRVFHNDKADIELAFVLRF